MLSKKLADALSKQVVAEYYSAYLYLSMSAAANKLGLKGASNWLFVQAQEEMAHGTNMFQYILERGEMPQPGAIDKPPADFNCIREIYDNVYDHEKKVSAQINGIATLAMQEGDHACYHFIMWYVNEQVEEESNVTEILDKLKLIGDNNGMLLTFDNELATRVFVDPFPAAAN